MSLILDALRKSERSRQQTLTGQVSAAGTPPARARVPVPWAMLIGILLIANATALAIIFWRNHGSVAAPVVIAAHAPVASSTRPPAPAYHPEVRSLALEAAAAAGTPPAATVPAIVATTAPVFIPAETPATESAAAPAPATVPAAGPAIGMDHAPPLDSLPLSFQQSLPLLHLDVHSYSTNPAERFVVINMQRYRTGDTLKEGPKVIAIVPDGVILEYHGQTFLLPRP